MNKAGLVSCYPCILHILIGLVASQIHDDKLGWNREKADRITDFSLNTYFALAHVSNSNSHVATLSVLPSNYSSQRKSYIFGSNQEM